MTPTCRRLALFLMTSCALPLAALAQGTAPAKPVACTPAREMKASEIFGLWSASFTNPPAGLPGKADAAAARCQHRRAQAAGNVDARVQPVGSANGMKAPAERRGEMGQRHHGPLLRAGRNPLLRGG